ncbi:dioxygenase [Microbacterium sp. P04]|uniref:dioxygenase n=1 Tax=Microbacterium sp. P04 TaxID=3366947 RepID=UPI003746A87E
MATGGKDRAAREARERARVYRARQEFRASQVRRRTRDNVIAAIVGGVIVLGAIGAQVAYFTVGPGTPAPAETSVPASPTPAPTASDPASPSPTVAP